MAVLGIEEGCKILINSFGSVLKTIMPLLLNLYAIVLTVWTDTIFTQHSVWFAFQGSCCERDIPAAFFYWFRISSKVILARGLV